MHERERFDYFTERARKVLSLAQEEAQRFNHNYIGTEHLLLGLVREGDGIASKVLSNLGVELNKVRSAVEFIIGRGDRIVLGDIGLTPRAKTVIELAVDEAHRLNHHYIGTEHLLLGLIREGEGVAAGVLESLGVNLDKVRTATIQVLSQAGSAGGAPSTPTPDAPAPSPGGVPPQPLPFPVVLQGLHLHFATFTEGAHLVLSLAQEEAQRLNHNYIGTEHLLLGLIHEGEGVAAVVLTRLGVDLERARAAVERIIGRGDRLVLGDIGLTPRAKTVIELAVDEARRLNHHYLGTEHLLLGIVREGQGIAAGVLESLGVNLEKVRRTTIQVLSLSGSSTPPSGAPTTAPGGEPAPPRPFPFAADSQEGRFDRFTEHARRALSRAQEEAQRLEHQYIGTEHLLLGLVHDEDGDAAKVLAHLGVELSKVRSAVEFIIGRGDRIVMGDLGLTPRAKTVIELAEDEARRLDHQYIGTEHLLLGLVREGEDSAPGALESLGVTLQRVRAETLRVLRDQGGAPEA